MPRSRAPSGSTAVSAGAVAGALALLVPSVAITQTGGPTYRPCSPAAEAVPVSCVTADRQIRIARFSGPIDKAGGARLEAFIDANADRIVRIDTSVDAADEIYEEGAAGDDIQGTLSFPLESGGHAVTILVPGGRAGGVAPVHLANGFYHVRGYFLVTPVMGMHQGWLTTALQVVPDTDVLLSDKFEIE